MPPRPMLLLQTAHSHIQPNKYTSLRSTTLQCALVDLGKEGFRLLCIAHITLTIMSTSEFSG